MSCWEPRPAKSSWRPRKRRQSGAHRAQSGKKRILWLIPCRWQASLKGYFDEANECEIVGCDRPMIPWWNWTRNPKHGGAWCRLNNGGERRVNQRSNAASLKADSVLIFVTGDASRPRDSQCQEVLEKEGFPLISMGMAVTRGMSVTARWSPGSKLFSNNWRGSNDWLHLQIYTG